MDETLALVEPAALGELTGLRRRRAELVAAAAMLRSETPLMVSPMPPSVARMAVLVRVAIRARAAALAPAARQTLAVR